MSFNQFELNDHILQAIQHCGFTAPTPIQQQAIPSVLAGHDVLGLAQTGTGKTAAFILPTVQHLMAASASSPRVLILAPTRELAEQINTFTRTIIRNTSLKTLAVYGGIGKSGQIAKIRQGVDIVVACPGRLLDILNDKALDLSRVDTLILDEADHMFDQGFLPDIRRILRQLPVKRQNLVFSATMPDAIRQLASDVLVNPVTVQINHTQAVKSIAHRLFTAEQGEKTDLLMHLLQKESMATTLVFTRTKHKAKNLALRLSRSGYKATSLQGNLSQSKRQQALDGFKSGTYTILVATDIAARGIDVTGISHVINYDMPDTVEAYIHRTGRTGRAASVGEALTFATSEDGRMVRSIENSLSQRLSREPHQNLGVPRVSNAPVSVSQPQNGPGRPKSSSGNKNKRQTAAPMASLPQKRKRSADANIFGLANQPK
jgi:superfamily II DNA/RNA helicase